MKRKEDIVRILVAEAGDDPTTLDAYSDVSKRIVEVVTRKYPGTRIDLLSQYLKTAPHDKDVREHITALISTLRTYDLVLAYIPKPHMLNAVLVWNARENDVPVIAISQCQNYAVLAMASHVIPDLSELDRLLGRECS